MFNKRTEADNYPFLNLFNFDLLFKVYIYISSNQSSGRAEMDSGAQGKHSRVTGMFYNLIRMLATCFGQNSLTCTFKVCTFHSVNFIAVLKREICL